MNENYTKRYCKLPKYIYTYTCIIIINSHTCTCTCIHMGFRVWMICGHKPHGHALYYYSFFFFSVLNLSKLGKPTYMYKHQMYINTRPTCSLPSQGIGRILMAWWVQQSEMKNKYLLINKDRLVVEYTLWLTTAFFVWARISTSMNLIAIVRMLHVHIVIE